MLPPPPFIAVAALQAALVWMPAQLYAFAKRSPSVSRAASLTFAICVIQAVVLTFPDPAFLSGLKFNWFQKLSAFLLTLLAARLLNYKASDWGLGPPAWSKALILAFLLGVIGSVSSIVNDVITRDFATVSTEFFLFELTLPGLEEEPLYRGLLLAIWDEALGRPYQVLGVKMGWGVLISAALFTLGHTVIFDQEFNLVVARQMFVWVDLFVFSLAMAWLRYKFGSFWPAVIAHNTGNTCEAVASALLGR